MHIADAAEEGMSTGKDPREVLREESRWLSSFELDEIKNYPVVYYAGRNCANKVQAPSSGINNGYDNSDGEYSIRIGDHIAYRYEILGELGSGAFGQVVKVYDHKTKTIVALKLIRNQRKILRQAEQEVKILTQLCEKDPRGAYCIVRMHENFTFRLHICIVYELLGKNLYDYIKDRDYEPLTLATIRSVAARMLVALTFLRREEIIHCDLKPENVLIRDDDVSIVKVVDLGSACYNAKNAFTYIQSRFYRAPEVILEHRYGPEIDLWSFGCILCELANGDPVFPSADAKDQLNTIIEYLGSPPPSFIQASSKRVREMYFDSTDSPLLKPNSKGKTRVPSSRTFSHFLALPEDDDFISFVKLFLRWEPSERVAPREAMRHPFVASEFFFPEATPDLAPPTASSPDKLSVSGLSSTPRPSVPPQSDENVSKSRALGMSNSNFLGDEMKPLNMKRRCSTEANAASVPAASGGLQATPPKARTSSVNRPAARRRSTMMSDVELPITSAPGPTMPLTMTEIVAAKPTSGGVRAVPPSTGPSSSRPTPLVVVNGPSMRRGSNSSPSVVPSAAKPSPESNARVNGAATRSLPISAAPPVEPLPRGPNAVQRGKVRELMRVFDARAEATKPDVTSPPKGRSLPGLSNPNTVVVTPPWRETAVSMPVAVVRDRSAGSTRVFNPPPRPAQRSTLSGSGNAAVSAPAPYRLPRVAQPSAKAASAGLGLRVSNPQDEFMTFLGNSDEDDAMVKLSPRAYPSGSSSPSSAIRDAPTPYEMQQRILRDHANQYRSTTFNLPVLRDDASSGKASLTQWPPSAAQLHNVGMAYRK